MKQQDENLSLLLDDDSGADVEAVLGAVIADVNLQYRMRRYQMIGEVMRNELPAAIDTGFHEDVMARIRAEAASTPIRKHAAAGSAAFIPLAARRWFRPVAGLAVATGVALVTIATWQPLQVDSDPIETQASADEQKIQQLAQQKIPGGAVTVSTRVPDDRTRWKMENESPVLQQKLNAYLVTHTEYSNSMQGLIPQARVAGFDAQQ
jgi:negative regulator of sigma E activity